MTSRDERFFRCRIIVDADNDGFQKECSRGVFVFLSLFGIERDRLPGLVFCSMRKKLIIYQTLTDKKEITRVYRVGVKIFSFFDKNERAREGEEEKRKQSTGEFFPLFRFLLLLDGISIKHLHLTTFLLPSRRKQNNNGR